MQPDGNSFFEDVVSNSFNKTSVDEENILDEMYKSKYVHNDIIYTIFFSLHIKLYELHTYITVALKPTFMSSLSLCAVFL